MAASNQNRFSTYEVMWEASPTPIDRPIPHTKSESETPPTGWPAPSRHGNPFATCWTRPGALPFRFSTGESAPKLVAKLASQDWRGAIVGPHGAGKSTLLESLKPDLISAGRTIVSVALRDGQHRLPTGILAFLTRASALEILIIDGYEQLHWFERLRIAWHCRRNACGLLVTTHAPTRLPTLIQLAPNRELVTRLVADLCSQVSTHVTAKDVAASHDCHGSNLREIFFGLYDRHEQLRR